MTNDTHTNTLHRCQNCNSIWEEEQLCVIQDVFQRVAPGEPMPSGECPDCGALCHEDKSLATPRQLRYRNYVADCHNTPEEETEPSKYIALEYSDDYLAWLATFDTLHDALDYLNSSDTARTAEKIVDLDTGKVYSLKLTLA